MGAAKGSEFLSLDETGRVRVSCGNSSLCEFERAAREQIMRGPWQNRMRLSAVGKDVG